MSFSDTRSAPIVLLFLTLVPMLAEVAESTNGGVTTAQFCRAVNVCKKRLDRGKKCRIFPVPKDAIAPTVAPGTFELTLLRTGVWAYNDGTYFSLILKAGDHLAMVDIPDSPTSNKPDGSKTRLTDAAEQVLNGTIPKRIDIVYSHAHFDHIGGSTRFYNYMTDKYPSAKVFTWGTEEARKLIQKSVSKRAPIPNMIVGSPGRTFSLGRGLAVKMEIFGGHTENDLVVYIPRFRKEASVVMYVDVVFPKWVPPINFAITIDLGRYVSAQNELLKLDFDVFVGGHFRLGNRLDVMENVKYTEDLIVAAKKAVETIKEEDFAAAGIGKFSDPSAREFGNLWFLLFRVTRAVQMDACYRMMLDKWGCRLAGIDITGRGHCFTAITYLLTDY